MFSYHITLIASLVGNHLGVIPWNLETALCVVEAKTAGAFVCMGRGTRGEIESHAQLMAQRRGGGIFFHQSMNVVISSLDELCCPGCVQAFSREDALQLACRRDIDRIFVIGGPHLYQQFLPLAENLFVIQTLTPEESHQSVPDTIDRFRSTSRTTKVHEERGNLFRFAEYSRRT